MLFNWLAPTLQGSTCVDLFAGSGALGFEAASRGALKVTMIEISREAARQLKENCELLNATHIEIVCDDAFQVLNKLVEADIAFIDPPFDTESQEKILTTARPFLRDGALIYVECPGDQTFRLPEGFRPVKEKRVASVVARLIERVQKDD